MSVATTDHDAHGHQHDDHHHDHDHHELSWWRKYVFSTDHKMIGVQYGVTGLVFLFFGFMLMLAMRWQLAHPGTPIPRIGGLLYHIFGTSVFADPATTNGALGVMTSDGYNVFGAMHGTIMVF